MPLLAWIRGKSSQLLGLKDHPHAVALGAGLGMFWGFTPFFGLKTLLAMGTAKLCRGNVVASAIAVTLHDVTLPLSPFLIVWEYRVGCWMLGRPYPFHGREPHAAELLHASAVFDMGSPLLLGSLLVAVPLGLFAYWLMLVWLKRRAEAALDGGS